MSRTKAIGVGVPKGTKRPENCFKCWHCRRVDGMNNCCVCVAFFTKSNPPDLILHPYSGKCPTFFDKAIMEGQAYMEICEEEEGKDD